MREMAIAAICLLALGCEKKPAGETVTYTIPEAWLSRLESGQNVKLVIQIPDEAPRQDVYLTVPEGEGELGTSFIRLPVSTKAVVVDDTQPDKPEGRRKVKVKVAEGEHDGKVGEVLRLWIRKNDRS